MGLHSSLIMSLICTLCSNCYSISIFEFLHSFNISLKFSIHLTNIVCVYYGTILEVSLATLMGKAIMQIQMLIIFIVLVCIIYLLDWIENDMNQLFSYEFGSIERFAEKSKVTISGDCLLRCCYVLPGKCGGFNLNHNGLQIFLVLHKLMELLHYLLLFLCLKSSLEDKAIFEGGGIVRDMENSRNARGK